MKRIVFYGNCQAGALNSVYSTYVAPWAGTSSIYINAREFGTEQTTARLQAADVVVAQVVTARAVNNLAKLPGPTDRLLFPAVAGRFLWPFGGQSHPLSKPTAHRPLGPYDPELGDTYLNRKIKQGADVDATVEEYSRLDAAELPDLDRLLDVAMEQQSQRDEATGFSFAPFIRDNFRDKKLFLSSDHPALELSRRWIIEILQRYFPDADAIARVERGLIRAPFPDNEAPIHPAVIRHFGLSFLPETPTYQYGNEGRFTFTEFARRYMRYEWNEDLDDGLALIRAGRPDRAEAKLRAALAKSPGSSTGHTALSAVLADSGRTEEAVVMARRAVALGTNDPQSHTRLAGVFVQAGLTEEAEGEFRRAIACDPNDGAVATAYCRFLARHGRVEEALEPARQAASREPYNGSIRGYYASLLLQVKRVDEAEAELRSALALTPDSPVLLRGLSATLARRKEFAEAEAEARRAAALQPGNASLRGQLGSMLARLERYDEAEVEFRAALEAAPNNVALLNKLGHVFSKQDKVREALDTTRRAVELDPRNAALQARLDRLTKQAGRLDRPRPDRAAGAGTPRPVRPTEPPVHAPAAHLERDTLLLEDRPAAMDPEPAYASADVAPAGDGNVGGAHGPAPNGAALAHASPPAEAATSGTHPPRVAEPPDERANWTVRGLFGRLGGRAARGPGRST